MKNKNKIGNSCLITPYVGFGDLLYHTPTIRVLKKIYASVDVWCYNTEPLKGNKYISNLLQIVDDSMDLPNEFYFGKIFSVNAVTHPFLQYIHPSNIHTIDLIAVCCTGCTLLDEEKYISLSYEYLIPKVKKLCPFDFTKEKVIVVNPVIGWPSRTLPLEYYQELTTRFLEAGWKVILVGKEIAPEKFLGDNANRDAVASLKNNEQKTLYPIDKLPVECLSLVNKLTLAECAALYSISDIALNTENGNMVISCADDVKENNCWNLYIPSVTHPQYRLPYRKGGGQMWHTAIVHNDSRYYPASDYTQNPDAQDYTTVDVDLPSIDAVYNMFQKINGIIGG